MSPSPGTALPLTDAQLGIWFAAALDPTGSGYECAEVLELDGTVDVDRLVRAADESIAEVPALRVRLDVVDGVPVQHVRPRHASPRTRVLDLRDHPDGERAAREWMLAQIGVPRVLTGDGLRDARLVDSVVLRVPGRDAWFLRIHHVLADAYAFGLIEHRAARLYAGATTAATADEAPTAALEAAVEADAAHRASDRFAADVAHWDAVLADAPSPARLTRTAAAAGRRTASGDVDAAASVILRERLETAGTSWPVVVAALFADYVGAATGTADVLLGLPMTGRGPAALARVATCVNVVPLRVRVDATATVGALAADVAGAVRDARTHQRTRSEHVARAVGAGAVPPWTTAARINLKPFSTTVRFGERRARVVPLATGPVEDVELTVGIDDVTGALHLVLDANAATCTQAEVDAHVARLLHRLDVLAAQEAPLEVPLARLPVATPDERARLAAWNATQHPVPDTTLTALLAAALDRPTVPGEEPALVWDGGTTSRAELAARSRALAAVLVGRGVGPGDLVAVAAPRGPELMVALLAVLDAGAAYLPLDLDAPPARVAEVVALADPALVLTTPDVGSTLAGSLPGDRVVVTSATPDEVPRVDRRIPTPSDPAYVIFTSGSTGAPKGVVVPHAGIVNRLLWMQDAVGLAGGDAVLQKTPTTFDVSVWELFLPLLTGAPLVLLAPGAHRDPAAICAAVVGHDVSTLHFVPSMLRELRDHLRVSPADRAGLAARLRTIVCSGEALGARTVDDVRALLPGTRVLNLYGPTEASVDVTWWDCGQDAPTADPVPIGEPVWNTHVAVLDAAGRDLPPGAVGELHLAGVQLATGYLGRPDLTAERFVTRPAGIAGTTEATRWYRTGDTATWRVRPDGRGVVEYLGRGDRQVKIRGQRIELGEVEARVVAHDDVAAAAVLAVTDAVGDLELVAAVVARTRGELGALARDLRAALPGAMVPRVVEVDELPTTRHGKLDATALAAAAASARTGTGGRHVDDAWAALPGPDVGAVRSALARVLGHDDLHPDDAFFAVGGDSLKAARLVAALRDVGPRRPTIADVFAATSLADLALAVRGTSDERHATGVLLPVRRDGREVVACVHPAGGLSWCYAPMLRSLPADVALVGLQSPAYSGGDPARSIGALAQRYADALVDVADGRPVHLVGWSVGGVVAHDLAVRADDRLDVASLTLLDAYPSAAWRSLPAPDDVDAARALAVMGGLDGEVAEHGGPGGRALTTHEVLDRLRAADSPMAQLPERVLDRLPAVVGGHVRALREHAERVHRGDLTLVRATSSSGPGAVQDAVWDPWVDGTVREVPFDGAHVDLVSARGLELVASLLPIGERRAVRV